MYKGRRGSWGGGGGNNPVRLNLNVHRQLLLLWKFTVSFRKTASNSDFTGLAVCI